MVLSSNFWLGLGILAVLVVTVYPLITVIRDILTKTRNTIRARDHFWIEFIPRVGLAWDAIIKIDNLQTGQFTYKGRVYFAGVERTQKMYPPGRSTLAQVAFTKCYASAGSASMATNIYGKPSVDAGFIYSLINQPDTAAAMQLAREDSLGGKGVKSKSSLILWGVGLTLVAVVVSAVFSFRGSTAIEELAILMQKFIAAYGVQ